MSAVLVERIWKAHPLNPAYRCALLHIARQIPAGGTEILVSRTLVAQAIDTTSQTVTKALAAGEELGLCRVLKNGRVAFSGYDGVFGVDAAPARPVGVQAAPPSTDPTPPAHPTVRDVTRAFNDAWAARYHRAYPFKAGEDHRIAKELGQLATLDEVTRAAQAYVSSDDPYWSEAMHGFRLFHRHFHKFVVAPAPRRREADNTQAYLAKLRGDDGSTLDGRKRA